MKENEISKCVTLSIIFIISILSYGIIIIDNPIIINPILYNIGIFLILAVGVISLSLIIYLLVIDYLKK